MDAKRELQKVKEYVVAMALLHHNVSWVISNGITKKRVLHLPGKSSVAARYSTVFSDALLVKQTTVGISVEDVTIEGMFSLPEPSSTHATTEYQFLYVNHHWVRSHEILGLIDRVFVGLLRGSAAMNGGPKPKHHTPEGSHARRHPLFVLQLTCPSESFEVQRGSDADEILFSNSYVMKQCIYKMFESLTERVSSGILAPLDTVWQGLAFPGYQLTASQAPQRVGSNAISGGLEELHGQNIEPLNSEELSEEGNLRGKGLQMFAVHPSSKTHLASSGKKRTFEQSFMQSPPSVHRPSGVRRRETSEETHGNAEKTDHFNLQGKPSGYGVMLTRDVRAHADTLEEEQAGCFVPSEMALAQSLSPVPSQRHVDVVDVAQIGDMEACQEDLTASACFGFVDGAAEEERKCDAADVGRPQHDDNTDPHDDAFWGRNENVLRRELHNMYEDGISPVLPSGARTLTFLTPEIDQRPAPGAAASSSKNDKEDITFHPRSREGIEDEEERYAHADIVFPGAPPTLPSTLQRQALQSLRLVGQVDRKYVVVVTAEGALLAFDQHAVDERVRLESDHRPGCQCSGQYCADCFSADAVACVSVLPVDAAEKESGGRTAGSRSRGDRLAKRGASTSNAGRQAAICEAEAAVLHSRRDLMRRWGFSYSISIAHAASTSASPCQQKSKYFSPAPEKRSGTDTTAGHSEELKSQLADESISSDPGVDLQAAKILTLHSTPKIKSDELRVADLLEFVQVIRSNPSVPDVMLKPPAIDRIRAFNACRYAIKFGDTLTPAECGKLLGNLAMTKFPFQCAHGRPTVAPLLSLAGLANETTD
jgi:DNA mismatch repair ATPase MutL